MPQLEHRWGGGLAQEEPGGADERMASERELGSWREDAQLACGVVVDEDRLAEPELVRDALSVVLVDQRTVDHSECVAVAAGLVGEHTKHPHSCLVMIGHGGGLALRIGPGTIRPVRDKSETESGPGLVCCRDLEVDEPVREPGGRAHEPERHFGLPADRSPWRDAWRQIQDHETRRGAHESTVEASRSSLHRLRCRPSSRPSSATPIVASTGTWSTTPRCRRRRPQVRGGSMSLCAAVSTPVRSNTGDLVRPCSSLSGRRYARDFARTLPLFRPTSTSSSWSSPVSRRSCGRASLIPRSCSRVVSRRAGRARPGRGVDR